ncbi:hypothetical protein GCM10010252_62230 [Streptomyces aureoverticillatus]|nr:hypothetical protein GCM10010252_62230 [Streptomyces aureoverticillatus]
MELFELEDLVHPGEGGNDLGLPLLHERLAFLGQGESLRGRAGLTEFPCEHLGVFRLLGLRADRAGLLDLHGLLVVCDWVSVSTP